jgi:hypothetical protein
MTVEVNTLLELNNNALFLLIHIYPLVTQAINSIKDKLVYSRSAAIWLGSEYYSLLKKIFMRVYLANGSAPSSSSLTYKAKTIQ